MKDVLIKLFEQNGLFFLYDANKNKVLSLSSQAFFEINKFIHLSDYSSETITSLKKKGYLLENCIVEIEHPFTPYVENLLDSHISSLILQVTQNCNFSCRYCTFANNDNIGHTHNNKTMSFEIAKQCIDLLGNHCSDSSGVTISFYGGEPLLNFDLIRKCVEYSKNVIHTKRINYSMTSNLYLLNDEILNYLIENEFDLVISLDGPEHIQDMHRRLALDGQGTYKKVMQNVTKIKKSHPQYYQERVQFNPVIYYDESPKEIIDFFYNALDVPREKMHLQRVNTSGINLSFDPFSKDLKSELLLDNQFDSDYKEIIKDSSCITPCYHINGSCVPGVEKLFVSVDGDFYPCEKIKYLMNMGGINVTECKRCWAIRFCSRCCAHCDDGESTISIEMFQFLCQNTKKNVLSFLKKLVTGQ